MSSRHKLFTLLYGLGFTPWDGHALSPMLRALVEGDSALPAGTALDVGCGTGDTAIYLAKHGWTVTAVDYVDKPLGAARRKAATAAVDVDFAKANATRLSSEISGSDFSLVVDNGCMHGMSPLDRDAYVRELSTLAAPGGHLLLVAFKPGSSFGVPGITPDEVAARFTDGWTLQTTGDEDAMAGAHHYLLERDSSHKQVR